MQEKDKRRIKPTNNIWIQRVYSPRQHFGWKIHLKIRSYPNLHSNQKQFKMGRKKWKGYFWRSGRRRRQPVFPQLNVWFSALEIIIILILYQLRNFRILKLYRTNWIWINIIDEKFESVQKEPLQNPKDNRRSSYTPLLYLWSRHLG